MNVKYLKDMCCPQCDSPGPFNIMMKSIVKMHDDGYSDVTPCEYVDSDICTCVDCGYEGNVHAFKTKDEELNDG